MASTVLGAICGAVVAVVVGGLSVAVIPGAGYLFVGTGGGGWFAAYILMWAAGGVFFGVRKGHCLLRFVDFEKPAHRVLFASAWISIVLSVGFYTILILAELLRI